VRLVVDDLLRCLVIDTDTDPVTDSEPVPVPESDLLTDGVCVGDPEVLSVPVGLFDGVLVTLTVIDTVLLSVFVTEVLKVIDTVLLVVIDTVLLTVFDTVPLKDTLSLKVPVMEGEGESD